MAEIEGQIHEIGGRQIPDDEMRDQLLDQAREAGVDEYKAWRNMVLLQGIEYDQAVSLLKATDINLVAVKAADQARANRVAVETERVNVEEDGEVAEVEVVAVVAVDVEQAVGDSVNPAPHLSQLVVASPGGTRLSAGLERSVDSSTSTTQPMLEVPPEVCGGGQAGIFR